VNDEEKYYEQYLDMFLTPGWKAFIEDIEEVHNSYNIDHVKDDKELYRIQGERSILKRMLGFQNGIEAAYASLTDGQAE
jgi:hypothetical protein